MKKLLLAVLFTFALMPVMVSAGLNTTDLADFNDLSEVQKAEFAKQIALQAERNVKSTTEDLTASIGSVKVDDVEEWVEIGAKMGKMLGGAAKELGIAANEFAVSPLGMMTMGLIIWNYAGEEIYEIAVSGLWFLLMIPLWLIMFFKVNFKVRSYKEIRKLKWGKEVTIDKPVRELTHNENINATFLISLAIILVIGFILLA